MVMLHVSQCEIDVIVTLLIDQTALIYSHPTGLLDRYLRETQVCGFRGCVLARAANIFPPEEGVCLFASGGWQPPQTRKPATAVWLAVGGTLSLGCQLA